MNTMISHAEAQRIDLKQYSSELQEVMKAQLGVVQQKIKELDDEIKFLNHDLATNPQYQTDRSENMPYQIARDKRDMTLGIYQHMLVRQAAMQKGLYDEYTPTGTISLGTTVELRVIKVKNYENLDFLKDYSRGVGEVPDTFVFKLMDKDVSAAKEHFVPDNSPIGRAIIDKCAGDVVTANTNFGEITYKIERIF